MLSPQARISLKVVWAFFLLFCLCTRFWILRKRYRTPASIAGDVCVVCAWLVLVPTSGLLIYEDTQYLRWDGQPASSRLVFSHPLIQTSVRHIHFAMVYLYLSGLWLLKAGFVCLFFDLFSRRVGKGYRLSLYALTAWIIIAFLSLIFLCTFICSPVSENWSLLPKCNILTAQSTLYANYSLNSITDLWILALPLALVGSLELDFREKLGFFFVVIVGLSSICASTARFVVMYHFRQEFAKGDFESLDKYGHLILTIEDWSLAECWTALLAFCLPSFKVFLRRKRLATTTASTTRISSGKDAWAKNFGESWRRHSADNVELGNFTDIRSDRSLLSFTPIGQMPERIPWESTYGSSRIT